MLLLLPRCLYFFGRVHVNFHFSLGRTTYQKNHWNRPLPTEPTNWKKLGGFERSSLKSSSTPPTAPPTPVECDPSVRKRITRRHAQFLTTLSGPYQRWQTKVEWSDSHLSDPRVTRCLLLTRMAEEFWSPTRCHWLGFSEPQLQPNTRNCVTVCGCTFTNLHTGYMFSSFRITRRKYVQDHLCLPTFVGSMANVSRVPCRANMWTTAETAFLSNETTSTTSSGTCFTKGKRKISIN